ncbi:MAG: antitoxin VbhA family protein [Gammaproteobacteria bacterium]|nr:antitoxin VbhA family protein [Gammaproteobacteria bacterium]
MAPEHNNTDTGVAPTLSDSVRRAVDVARAAGEEVSAEAIGILERVEQGEIDTEEAVRLIIQLNSGG